MGRRPAALPAWNRTRAVQHEIAALPLVTTPARRYTVALLLTPRGALLSRTIQTLIRPTGGRHAAVWLRSRLRTVRIGRGQPLPLPGLCCPTSQRRRLPLLLRGSASPDEAGTTADAILTPGAETAVVDNPRTGRDGRAYNEEEPGRGATMTVAPKPPLVIVFAWRPTP